MSNFKDIPKIYKILCLELVSLYVCVCVCVVSGLDVLLYCVSTLSVSFNAELRTFDKFFKQYSLE